MSKPTPYTAQHHQPAIQGQGAYWVVEGPGVCGLTGTAPMHNRKMTKRDAEHLAFLMNGAYNFGASDNRRAMRQALGIADFDETLSMVPGA